MLHNYVYRWFVGQLDKNEAEMLLVNKDNQSGSYLVCENKTRSGTFTLYVRVGGKVLMYPIRYHIERGYFVTPQSTFTSVQELIGYYQQKAEGLCSKLEKPCVVSQTITSDNREVVILLGKESSELMIETWHGLINKKAANIRVFSAESMHSQFIHELEIMKKLCHKNIISLLGASTSTDICCIVTEFMHYGSLSKYLHIKSCEQSPTEKQLIGMASQIALGMQYLESQQYVHRNIAAKSIFVAHNLVCKIGNFHFAIPADGVHEILLEPAIRWTAPEAILHRHYSHKSDVWSFGIPHIPSPLQSLYSSLQL